MKIPEKIPEFLFSIRFNRKRSLATIVIASLLTFLTVRCGLSENDLLKLYNEIRKGIIFDLPDEDNIINEFDNQLNQRVIKDPKLLQFKIENEVNDAIHRYEKETGDDGRVRLPTPRYSERPVDDSVCHSEDCKALGGEMRLCSPWIESCPDDSKSVHQDFSNSLKDAMIDESLNKSAN